jgi:hypothetical protein
MERLEPWAPRENIVEMLLLRAITLALGALVVRSAPVVVFALMAGFWTGWFDTHPAVLAALIGWLGLVLVEMWIEIRRWKAKRNARKTPQGATLLLFKK